MRRGLGLGRKRRQSLTNQAFAAIRRAGGTVLAAGAAVPVLGPELCTDGGFNVGVADWTAAGGVHTWTGSALRRAIGQGNAGSYRDFTVTPNAEYLVGGAILNAVGSGGLVINIYGGGGFTGLLASLPATGYAFVRPTTSTLRIYFYTDNTRGADLDDVTVRLFSGYTYGNPPTRNYFDSAGTDILDSVTQVDQPVGLVLDAAGTVGPELCPNGTFDSGATDWIAPAGWVIGAGVVTATATSASFRQASTPLTPGKTYQVEFDYTHTSGTLYVRVGAGPDTTFNSSGRKSAVLKATTSAGVEFYGGAVTGVIDNISVRELTGNHATQPTTGSKPTLRRGLVNQLLWSGDFSNAVWTKTGATVVTGQADPLGGTSASKLVESATTGAHYFLQSAVSGSGTATTAWVVKAAGRTKIKVRSEGPQTSALSTTFNLSSGTVAAGTGSIIPLGNDFFLCVANSAGNGNGTSGYHLLQPLDDSYAESYTGDGTSGILLHRAALYQGTVTAQQILAAGGIPLTTTAPASSALGNYWWQYDPTAPGDFLQTSITTGNEGWVCAGVTQNAAATCYPFAAGGVSDAVAGANLRLINGTTPQIQLGDGIARQVVQSSVTPTLGTPFVYSGGWNASTAFVDVNGTEVSAARTRNPTATTPATIGQAAGGGFVQGAISVIVICPTLPPPADRALIRAWVAKQQGQTL